MSLRALTHWVAAGLLIAGGAVTSAPFAGGQEQIQKPQSDQITRKVKSRIAPLYPDLAKRMNVTGVVKVQITVDKNGMIKNAKLVGGHPILANAAMDAVRKWRYESGSDETTGVVEFHFDATQ